MGMVPGFDYDSAFSRNLGLISPQEQQRLRHCRVAIAGLGGVGGAHVLTHARMGIGKFHLADFDTFEVHNFNRQAGATMSSLNQEKVEVMRKMALDINPEAEVAIWKEGIKPENIDAFLAGVDLMVDGLDFFAVGAREMLYRETRARGIPVVAAGPIGAGVSLTVFVPNGMSWHEFFGMAMAKNELEKYLLFYLGNAPTDLHGAYIDRSYIKLAERKGPSLGLATQLCSGMAAAESMKLLLGRGNVFAAPFYHQFDAYRGIYRRAKLRWGNRGPLQRLKFILARKKFAAMLPQK